MTPRDWSQWVFYCLKMSNWIKKAREAMVKKGTVGSLHSELGVPQGKKIPQAKLDKAANSKSSALRKKANFALNVKK